MSHSARSAVTHEIRALLLARVAYGEADLVVTFFSDTLGRFSALARGARRSTKRFGGSLEPMHTLKLEVDERPGAELLALRSASLSSVRTRLTANLESLEVAGRALGWLKKSAPVREPEPLAWVAIEHVLDRLDGAPGHREARLVELGVRLLVAFGWGLDLTRCVRCGKPCPEGQTALVSPERGGLICRACGGGPLRLTAALRTGLLRAAQGEDDVLPEDEIDAALVVVERALATHMGLE